ncbi:hypothetical protein C8J36_103264 [Rhizobium sp. PP-F2F-G48]|uniref:hypothetical protein n=1 Tax=Rhizobium sp. PP-F2F-G48 TaxID=2135651 RepID=UPI0010523E94|nr:hypothetical protein [Rhizobium sp. PP-F2F-G48]TCM55898.1 hypothetical protein C8J36_103264 [Rhizobium sp. PP-F2F-G48]
MRAFVLALSVLCAILSGWTSAMAQAQGLAHGDGIAGSHAVHDDGNRHSGSPDCPSGCHASTKGTHPMLCSACFALEVEAGDIGRLALAPQRLRPAVELPLIALTPEPAAPPPRSALST